jgi:hypothetical protein
LYANPDEDAVELELSVSVEARAVVGDESTAASKVLSRGSDSCSSGYASKRVGQSLSELHASYSEGDAGSVHGLRTHTLVETPESMKQKNSLNCQRLCYLRTHANSFPPFSSNENNL